MRNINTKINTKPATGRTLGVLIYFLSFLHMDMEMPFLVSDAEINNLNKYMVVEVSHRWQLWNGPIVRKEIKNISQ
jgi:hypothetical protein